MGEKKKRGDLSTFLCCWKDLLYGQACCIYNLVFAPCVLAFWSCNIYFCGCLKVYMNRGFYKICCCFCRTFNCCWEHTDRRFPPNTQSLGALSGDSANKEGGKMGANVLWLRAGNFATKRKMQLFGDTVDANDICQGALGNCWLLAAMACLAEHPGAINAVFVSKERNPTGKYQLRLFDGVREKWETITIDDFIPCDKDRYEKDGVSIPVFSQPNGNELYAMLLEKAVAKFCGTYAATEGGQTIWAIRAMTGDPARMFKQNDAKTGWLRNDLVNVEGKDPKDGDLHRRDIMLQPCGEELDNAMMFDVLLKYHYLRSVLCASGSSGRDGLHTGHAYSILDVKKVTPFMGMGGTTTRLVQVRNPWGSGEWTGDWGDASELWDKYPAVKSACRFENVDDGAFWMSWEDYIQNWKWIGVIDRTVDIKTLRLNLKDDSCCAPTIGCCKGCSSFWCCCTGCKRLYCPHRSSDETVKVKKCCSCAIL